MIISSCTRDFIKLVSLLVFLSISGCATAPVKIETLNIESFSNAKIPLKIALYMPPSFSNYIINTRQPAASRVAIGEGLRTGAAIAFKNVFQDLTIIEVMDSKSIDAQAIISPELIEVDFNRGSGAFATEVAVICKWTIVDRTGKIYYMNTVTGVGQDSSILLMSRTRKSSTYAIEDHYKKMIFHMTSKKWWENIK